MTKIREFATTWGSFRPHMWYERDKETLIGAAQGTDEDVPNWRPFDMLTAPIQSLTIFENADMRIGVESNAGAWQEFRRNSDYDMFWFQFAGQTTLESEYGTDELHCGETLLIPAGVAYRATGSADCLRLWAAVNEPVPSKYSLDGLVSHSEFDMVRHGGPQWEVSPAEREAPRGEVTELTYFFNTAEPRPVRRRYEQLVGIASEGRGLHKLRAFDAFTEITGERGPGPKLYESPNFVVEAYNTEGEQFAFHRALNSVEMWLHFRGDSINESEFGAGYLLPGEMNYAPVGVSHRAVGCPGFLRLVLYSHKPWRLAIDPTQHQHQSRFEARERVLQVAAWRG